MIKIEQIEAAARADLNDEGQCDAFMELYGLKAVLKMCAVIKAAESMGYENTADSRKAFWSTLKELNK
jgi:hypothetical protein